MRGKGLGCAPAPACLGTSHTHPPRAAIIRRLTEEVVQHELVQAWWWEGAGRIDLLAPRVWSNPVAQLSFATVPQLLHVSAPKSTALF